MGIVIIGIFWVASSLYQLMMLSNWPLYQHMFGSHYLSASWVLLRYTGSLAQRILGLIAGFGLVEYRRWAAKIIIILSVFNVVTVFWKHPYEAFRSLSIKFMPREVGIIEQSNIPFSLIVWLMAVLVWVLNELYFCSMIYYLTRPQVKARLK